MKTLRLACFALASVAASTVHAQDATQHVSWSKIQMDAWTMTPICNDDNTVHSFLALMDTNNTLGSNIAAVWYIRDGQTWTTQSWETTDPWEAIKSVKSILNISEDEDERWGIPGDDDSIKEAMEPAVYFLGVMASDPMAAYVAGAPDRDALISYLTSIGHPAADVPVEQETECTTEDKLNALVTEIEDEVVFMETEGWEAGTETSTILNVGNAAQLCQIAAGPPRINPRPAVPGILPTRNPPGTVPGGSPPGTGWTPGGWTLWTCTPTPLGGGAVNCICTRSRRWGRWEARCCFLCLGTCARWIEVIETETCTTILPPGSTCPGMPNTATYTCTAATPY